MAGIDEKKFRSARLCVWFNTPEEYYKQQLDIYKTIKPKEDTMAIHEAIQAKYPPLAAIDTGKPADYKFKVFGGYD